MGCKGLALLSPKNPRFSPGAMHPPGGSRFRLGLNFSKGAGGGIHPRPDSQGPRPSSIWAPGTLPLFQGPSVRRAGEERYAQ